MFQSQYIEKLLNVSQCFSIFSQFFWYFFDIFGQKWRLNLNFRPNFTLLIKNRKPNMGLNICLLWTIFCYLKKLTIFKKIPTLKILKSTLKHWKHWIKFNVEILNNIDIELSFNVIFLTSKTLNQNQCQCWCRPLMKKYRRPSLYAVFLSAISCICDWKIAFFLEPIL